MGPPLQAALICLPLPRLSPSPSLQDASTSFKCRMCHASGEGPADTRARSVIVPVARGAQHADLDSRGALKGEQE